MSETSETPETVAKADFDALSEQHSALNKTLGEIASDMLAAVPDNLKALVPEGLSPADQIKWFQKANAAGVFKPSVPTTDTSKPKISPKQGEDISALPRVLRMAAGYKK